MASPLVHEGGSDYELRLDDNCWITVRNLSVHIRDAGEGVSILIYPLGKEDEDPISDPWVSYGDGYMEESQ